jgi:hypothetical protein
MRIHYDTQILRSKLVAMTRLTQRTMDYFVNPMQDGRPELSRAAQNSREEMSAIRCWFASHGRALLRTGISADADSRFVSAAMRIAGALEVAHDAAIAWLEEIGRRDVASEGPAYKPAHDNAMLASGVCTVQVSEMDSLCKVLDLWSAIPPRQAPRMNPPDDCSIPPRDFAEAIPNEDFTQARLIRLQQRVCELLVKNQQLRMALMAERTASHPTNFVECRERGQRAI